MPAPRKYDEETRTRAVRMYRDRVADSGESMIGRAGRSARCSTSTRPTLRSWIERDEIVELVQEAWLSRASRRRGDTWLAERGLPLLE